MQHVTNTHFGKMLRRTTLCALTSFALLGSTALVPAFAAPDPLKSQAQIDQPTVLAGGTRVVYVAVSLEGIDVDPGKASPRPPLNVSLVLDRSGSMSDQGKIEYLRKASKLAVDRLNSQDTLSIVEYDDQITLMVPAKRVGNLSEVKAMIDALEPRGSTNLAGGMVRGAEEARGALNGPASGDGTITRVMLMSDGLANTGVTNPQEIAELVRKAKSGGVRISAMGLGREYDEDLMQAIAENGGGHYYYIENPSQMARIFQEELGTMLETCAKDIEIDFSGKSAVRKAELVGYDDAKGTQSLHRGVEDLYEGEKRSLLIRLEIAAPASGRLDLGSFSLK